MVEYNIPRRNSLTVTIGDVGDIDLLLVNGYQRQAGQYLEYKS